MNQAAGATPSARTEGKKFAGAVWVLWLVPTLSDIVFLGIVALILVFLGQQFVNSDGDLARHLALGQYILSERTLPVVDLWSHTKMGEPFVPFEWLSEVILAGMYQLSGLPGVMVLAAATIALPFLLITRWSIRDGADPFVTLVLVTVGAMAASIHWLARPHVFSILIALLWTRSLFRFRETGAAKHLIPLPVLMVFWVNMHGGFIAGFAILAVFMGAPLLALLWPVSPGEAPLIDTAPTARHTAILAGAGVASAAATGVNPAGYYIWPHMMGYFQLRFMLDNTIEHMSPNFHQLAPQLFISLALLGFVSMAWLSRRADPVHLGLLTVWTAFGVYSVRHIPMFVLICTPIIARAATDVVRDFAPRGLLPGMASMERRMGGPVIPLLGTAVALLLFTGATGTSRPPTTFSATTFPAEAIAAADRIGVTGNLFNYFPWGGYLLFATGQRYPIFIDGETEMYGDQITKDYSAIYKLDPRWEELMDQYQIGWVLIPHESPLSQMLERTPGWSQPHQDNTADIFTRDE